MITLRIDGKEIKTPEGKSILKAARENGIAIPTLCYYKELLPIGSCRLCIVEVDGYDRPVTSCNTPALDGISVTTQSEKLRSMRREYLQLILSYHPLDCPQCDKGGECRLQDLVYAHGIERTEYAVKRDEKGEAYATPLIRYWENRCVLCGRCYHACREISGREAIDIAGNGYDARVSAVNAGDCISCGECISLCPVGALTERLSPVKKRIWQGDRIRTTCPHCGFGCQLVLDLFEGRTICKVITDGDAEPNGHSLCVRGRFGYDFANSEALLRTARISTGNTPRTCDPEEALNVTAEHLKKLSTAGKGTGFIVSARATNEEIYLVSKIAELLGKSPVGSSACYHTGKVVDALGRSGIKQTVGYAALSGCDCIIIAGAGLLANNHVLANKVRSAVKKTGARVVVIDPLPTPLTRIADAHLQVEPLTDACLFNYISGRLIQEGKHAREAERIEGFSDFASSLKACGRDHTATVCGLNGDDLDKAYSLIRNAARTGVIFGSGISAGDESMAALLNFCLLKNLQKQGAVLPVALQANALGAVTVAEGLLPADQVLCNSRISGLVLFEDNPFTYLSGQLLQESLSKKDFIAVCDALPSPAMDLAHVALPSATFARKNGTFISGDGTLRRLKRATGNSSRGFEFLSRLLHKLGGPLFTSPEDVGKALAASGVLEKTLNGAMHSTGRMKEKYVLPPPSRTTSRTAPKTFKLILRDLFISDYLVGKPPPAKGMNMIYRDALYISPEDASTFGVQDGDFLVLENELGSSARSVTVKEGLKNGVLEAVLFTERQDLLKLATAGAKVIDVSLSKG